MEQAQLVRDDVEQHVEAGVRAGTELGQILRHILEDVVVAILVHVVGGSQDTSAAILWELGDRVPEFHIHPRVTICLGQTKVLTGAIFTLFSRQRCKTLSQFLRRSGIILLAHTCMSSAM